MGIKGRGFNYLQKRGKLLKKHIKEEAHEN